MSEPLQPDQWLTPAEALRRYGYLKPQTMRMLGHPERPKRITPAAAERDWHLRPQATAAVDEEREADGREAPGA